MAEQEKLKALPLVKTPSNRSSGSRDYDDNSVPGSAPPSDDEFGA
jgi:hypothetical protein